MRGRYPRATTVSLSELIQRSSMARPGGWSREPRRHRRPSGLDTDQRFRDSRRNDEGDPGAWGSAVAVQSGLPAEATSIAATAARFSTAGLLNGEDRFDQQRP